ncbi:MAG: hypothetical protein VXW94_01190, partial [Pseudomonadota bacterium]|nr:hypothetical protein [Pseudomonadota bacterium]
WREVPRAFYRVLPLVHHYTLGNALTVFRAEHFRDHAGCPVVQSGFKERQKFRLAKKPDETI